MTAVLRRAGYQVEHGGRKPFEIKMLLETVAACIASSSTDETSQQVTHA